MIIIFDKKDFLHNSDEVGFDKVSLKHFTHNYEMINEADTVLYCDGINTKVLKTRH